MRSHIGKFQVLAVGCLALFIALYVWNTGAARQKEPDLPKVISEAKGIEVVNVRIKEDLTLIVTVRNNTDKAITALTLQAGDGRDEDAVTVAGYREGDEPDIVIIKAHATYDMDMPLNYVRPGRPVRVSGVSYEDGTEEGNDKTLELMRDQKKQTKLKKSKREGGSPQ